VEKRHATQEKKKAEKAGSAGERVVEETQTSFPG